MVWMLDVALLCWPTGVSKRLKHRPKPRAPRRRSNSVVAAPRYISSGHCLLPAPYTHTTLSSSTMAELKKPEFKKVADLRPGTHGHNLHVKVNGGSQSSRHTRAQQQR